MRRANDNNNNVMSPEALLRSMRNRVNFDDEELSKYSFGLFANEGWHLLRCKEGLAGLIDAFVI